MGQNMRKPWVIMGDENPPSSAPEAKSRSVNPIVLIEKMPFRMAKIWPCNACSNSQSLPKALLEGRFSETLKAMTSQSEVRLQLFINRPLRGQILSHFVSGKVGTRLLRHIIIPYLSPSIPIYHHNIITYGNISSFSEKKWQHDQHVAPFTTNCRSALPMWQPWRISAPHPCRR